MAEDNKKPEDAHGTEATTRWVHKHPVAAKRLVRTMALAASSLAYYLRRQQKKIEQEEKQDK